MTYPMRTDETRLFQPAPIEDDCFPAVVLLVGYSSPPPNAESVNTDEQAPTLNDDVLLSKLYEDRLIQIPVVVNATSGVA